MGRKRRRGGAEPRLVLLAVVCVLLLNDCANSDGEVGCLFSKNLCNEEAESCYNDLAFGRCVQLQGDLSEKDLYQYNLEPGELELLRLQLERLEYQGYKWPHDYTQCVMQLLLDDLRYRLDNDVEDLCKNLKWQTEDVFEQPNGITDDDRNNDAVAVAAAAAAAPSGNQHQQQREQEQAATEPVAIVKFNPSKMSPHGEFADEFYYPPGQSLGTATTKQLLQQQAGRKTGGDDDYDESFYDKLGDIGANPSDQVYRRGSRSLKKQSSAPGTLQSKYGIPAEYAEALQRYVDEEQGIIDRMLPDDRGTPLKGNNPFEVLSPEDYYKAYADKDWELPKQSYYQPSAQSNEDDADDYDEVNERRIVSFDDDDDDGVAIPKPIIDSLSQSPSAGLYSDDAIVPLRRDVIIPDEYEDLPTNSELDDMLWGADLAGFKRRERLDVKKPGPPFLTNNYAFKTQSPPSLDNEISEESESERENENQLEDMKEVIYLPVKKEISNSKLINSPKTYENVDLDYVYIEFNQRIKTWEDGKRIVQEVVESLGLDPEEFRKGIRVGLKEVTFKVPKNSKNYNATEIASGIDSITSVIKDKLNVDVVGAGIGDKIKLPSLLKSTNQPVALKTQMNSSMFGAMVAAGAAAVTAGAIVILVIARRHAKSRAKLAGLRTPDPEASKDYQDLCRARMAKQSDKKSDGCKSPRTFDFGKLIESGRSESVRSSTSSWGEEPAVTNMDIATGHVVLSYMEEHLKNTQKLEEEWAALCSYEPDPCSTAIALAEGNSECNRTDAAIPYDHSRVVLNDLANLNNSDYINASTITDHDPRNPAYIATQGPLPQTAPDFWQLIWEQGSVVIVMLTRLTEDGQAMCHRYWPEEGSELYHIYEVHLVSEHIWCDDYLVRSFYLKNLRTGETRTVTQFHFLAWPQNGVPSSIKTLLEFRRKVNKSYRGRACPIIVHCSDGAGRTGTYCLIDMVLNRMSKGAKEIDIAATLEHIRDQRAGMVATKQQYEFVLMAVAEEVHAILKSLPIVAEKSLPDKSSSKSDK